MKLLHHASLSALALALSGCAAGSVVGGLANAALDAIGARKAPQASDADRPPRKVALKLHAADKLNTDAHGQALALVTRWYMLRHNAAFEQAPFDTFLSPQKEREAFGADLLEVKEIMLVPGQHYEALERISREAYFVGVVALFRSPAEQRWRLSFAVREAEQTGLVIGAHACALSVGVGQTSQPDNAKLLAPVHCQ